MTFEFNILTNDGWVVTLLSDKPIGLADTAIYSVIVQPIEAHNDRLRAGTDSDVIRTEYRLRRA